MRLVTDLCVDYEIYDLALWNNAVKQLMSSRQHGYLSKLLISASGVPCLWELATLSSAWKAAVEHFLQAAGQATSPVEAERFAMEAFQLISRTPFVLAFDLQSVSVCFHGLGLYHLAVGAALMLPEVRSLVGCLVDGLGGSVAIRPGLRLASCNVAGKSGAGNALVGVCSPMMMMPATHLPAARAHAGVPRALQGH